MRSILPAEARSLWFDAEVDPDAERIRELERGFRRDGLPNLIVDL